ncbi:MAG: thiol peroxidase [Chloroflexi bacterium]|nr:thiol peroxidase [Chloroflexota bacterium]
MKVGDREHPVQNAMLEVGQPAPDWTLIANNNGTVKAADYAGKIKILSIVPSLDTRVCAAQTRRFNEEASKLNDQIVVLTISADLPFAQRRWCGAEGIERVVTLSCHRDMQFADDYGVHDTEWRICQRAVFVVDADNIVRHAEYVYNMGSEPDYIAALAAAQKLV